MGKSTEGLDIYAFNFPLFQKSDEDTILIHMYVTSYSSSSISFVTRVFINRSEYLMRNLLFLDYNGHEF